MTLQPEIEVGAATAAGEESFDVGARAATEALASIRRHPLSVVFVYASAAYDLEEVLRGVASVVGDAPVIGATTAGEICGAARRGGVVVSAWASPHLSLSCALGRNLSQDGEDALRQAISSPSISPYFALSDALWLDLAHQGKSVFAVVFMSGGAEFDREFDSCGHEIVEALKGASGSRFPILAAGAAGDPQNAKVGVKSRGHVLHGRDAIHDGLLIAIFETRLQFGIALTHGFAPGETSAEVTQAIAGEVLTIGGESAADWLPAMLGKTRAELEGRNPSLAAKRMFGALSGLGQFNPVAGTELTPRGGCRFSRALAPGTMITTLEPARQSMRLAASEALRKAMRRGGIQRAAIAMMGYGALRRRFMGLSDVVEEIENSRVVLGDTPLFGFFAAGEGGVTDDGVSRYSDAAVTALVLGAELSPQGRTAIEAERLRLEMARKVEALEASAGERLVALQRSEERFQLAMRGANDGLWDWDVVTNNVFLSPRWKSMLGYEDHEIENRFESWVELLHPDDAETSQARLRECVEGDGNFETEFRLRRKQGRYVDILSRAIPVLDENGKVVRLVGTNVDISEHKRIERSQRQAAAVFNSTDQGIIVTDARARIISVNRAFTAITGYSETEILVGGFRLLQSKRQNASFYHDLWRSLCEDGRWQGEIWNKRKNGEIYPEWLTVSAVRDEAGALLNYVGVFSDITPLKDSERRLQHIAHHDPLTDLPNRLLLADFLERSVSRARRTGAMGAVLFIDLDRFKTVNDSLGHAAGDALLVLAVRRLRERLRASDLLSRHGGDEFVVVLEDIAEAEDAGRIAEKLIAALSEEPFELGDAPEVCLGASIGISLFPSDAACAAELIQYADTALYEAKAQGRGSYRYFDKALTKAAESRLDMEARLRRALERQEFILHYQPLVDLATGRIEGVEALVRWLHPELGLISPDRFIPLTEETGLIIPLGLWVLHVACAQAKRWRDMGFGSLTLSVNLSPRQFNCASLVEDVRDVLVDTGLPGSCLELEITEGAVMQRGQAAEDRLAELKTLGVSLAIDDFGTGYSSLAYLKRMPLDRLKIDRSFIKDMTEGSTDAAIVSAVIEMSKSLGFQIVAEGVETEEQVAALQARGCDTAQGYFFARPMPPEDIYDLLNARQPLRRDLVFRESDRDGLAAAAQ